MREGIREGERREEVRDEGPDLMNKGIPTKDIHKKVPVEARRAREDMGRGPQAGKNRGRRERKGNSS